MIHTILKSKFKTILFRCFIVCVFMSISIVSFATHIVGGSLTYVHNGGSSYTITLKLYRDCGPGTAGFPGTVNIDVRGNNGANFSPSRDISMSLGTVTAVPSSLDPCAVPPTPLPCVEEGIYTTTVNNLPPNAGGYHMDYQIIARNLSIVNVDATCNCIGESFYAYIPGTTSIWDEDFSLPNNTTVDNGATAWSVTNGVPAPASAMVNNNRFEFRGDDDGVAAWSSQVINIAANPGGVDLTVNLSENGNFEASDNISVFYRLNGGAEIMFATNGSINNDFGAAIASQAGVVGLTVQIVVRVNYGNNSPNNERYRINNVSVSGEGIANLSNPEFTLFPPLFLCVGQPFTFDHSATDLDGDSLVYSFYDPYNGDNGAGPLDPTFAGNVATFTPVVWQPGFSATNPLGGTPLNLDPSTGMLSGTPSLLGQFVLGIKVEEYRNGLYIGETLRDFQMNVVNCPAPTPPLAGNDLTINDGCIDTINASGYIESTVTWTSVFPGAPGTYDGFLSCTSGCLDPIVSSFGTPPPFVDYVVCGTASACNSAFICDTIRIAFNPTLSVAITPIDPVICFGQTSTTITATGSGGTPPYSYLWNNVNPSQTNVVGGGNFTVMLSDSSGCPPVFSTITVTTFANPITADAGLDDTLCIQNPVISLNGSITGATGGVWSGGNGTFSPNATTLAGGNYVPTAAEIAAGFVDLILTSTGNGVCPLGADTVRFTFLDFIGNVTVVPTNVSCYSAGDGSATVNITGGIGPFTYFWNTVPAQTTATANNLSPGTYTVMIQNGIGCTTMDSVVITEPTPLALNSSAIDVSCFGGNDGSITVTAVGGTSAYTYSWSPGGQVGNAITAQMAGNYSVTVTDANNCTLTLNDTILEPASLAVSFTQTNVTCLGGNDGSATATIVGGTGPFTYSWSPSGSTANNATGLTAGTHVLTITDANNCSQIDSVIIAEPLSPVDATVTVANISCSGFADGSAVVTPTGGTAPYTYLWSPGGQTTDTINGLSSGNYNVSVTDTNGCVTVEFVTVTEPNPLVLTTNQVDITCFGDSSGVGTVNVLGGTPGYSYLWATSGDTTNTADSLFAGNHLVTVTDSNGCQASTSIAIAEPALPVFVSTLSMSTSCNGISDGTATATGSGGVAPYTYSWFPGGQTGSSITGLAAGDHVVIATDANGCVATDTVTVIEPVILSVTFTQSAVSCNGGSNGTASATVTGGTGPYNYLWMPGGAITNSVAGLSAGNHVFTVTDGNNCVLTDSITIVEPFSSVGGNIMITDVSCNGGNDGIATVSGVGGTPGYTYLWDAAAGNQVSATAVGLMVGSYTVLITDLNGCSFVDTAVINQPAPINVSFNSQLNVSCFGGNDGAVSASVSGGTPNYNYLWAPGGATTNSVSGLAAGNYTVTVTDNNSCQTTNSVIITQPVFPVSVNVSSTANSCNGGSDGTASAIGFGGTGPYTYSWIPGGQVGATITGLAAGTYTVTATDSNGCEGNNSVLVVEPFALSVSFTQTNVSCNGGSNGSVSAVTSGGSGPYTYLWMPGGATTNSIAGLVEGNYVVTVTDLNGCTLIDSVTITEPFASVLGNISVTNVSCNGGNDGTATASGIGGTPGYTYLWDSATGNQVTATATGLFAGTYTVLITDANGCTYTDTAVVNQPLPISVAFGGQMNVSCFGGNNGAVSAGASGGTPNYSYLWAPGGSTASTISALTAGVYSLTVTDNNGCQGSGAVTITQPIAAVSIAVSSTPTSCNGGNDGTATAVGSGGTAPYTYSWLPGGQTGSVITGVSAGTYTVVATDVNGCSTTNSVVVSEPLPIVLNAGAVNSTCGIANGLANVSVTSGGTAPFTYFWTPTGGTTATITGLFSGVYTVVVTDANGCTATAAGNVNDIASPALSIISVTNVSCNGGTDGTATVTTTGGIGPFTYLWSPSGETTPTAVNLSAGPHSVVVTGSNGCQSSVAVSPVITQPDPIVTSVTTTPVSCNGGSDGTASAVSIGGTPGYMYQWLSNGSTGITTSALSAGLDSVVTTDANGCTDTTSFTIAQPVLPISIVMSSTAVSCNGGNDGTASSLATGGTGPYVYNWMPGNISGQNISGLPIGTYIVTVTDLNGCTGIDSVVITEPTLLTLVMSSTNSTCGLPNGQSMVTPSGGTAPYSYSWFPSGANTALTTGLLSGLHTVTVTDANGCQQTASVTVNNTAGATASVTTTTTVSCNGGSDGTATVAVVGGTPPFTYAWSPIGGTGPTATGLSVGTYTVVVTDANNCLSNTATTPTILQPDPIVTTLTTTPVNCNGGSDGMASAVSVGGTPGYTYQWLSSGATGASISTLSAGLDSLITTDINGCIDTTEFTITEPAAPVTISLTSTAVSCNGGSDGTVSVVASGGTAPYSYNWMPGNISGSTISNLSIGTYIVTVTDLNGCTETDSVVVTEPTLLSLVISSTNSTCGLPNGQTLVTPTGGTAPYTYSWFPSGITDSIATGLLSGQHNVIVTDNNGCIQIANVIVNNTSGPVASISGTTSVTCNGGADGTATVNVVGGTPPFTYAWSPIGGTGVTATGLSTGTYTVLVTDSNNCPSNTAITPVITQPNPIITTVTTTPVNCNGGSDGTASAVSVGGTAGYNYLWLPSGTGAPSIATLSAGLDSVRTTDANGCQQTQTFLITEPTPLSASVSSVTDVSCFGGNDGSATILVSGGTPFYSYNWSPMGGNSATGVGLVAGNYTVTVTDINGCTLPVNVTISEPSQSLSATASVTSPNCFGGANGIATITPTGGTAPYTYLWSPFNGTNQTEIGLTSGTYTVLVTDTNGCEENLFVTVSQPSLLTGTLDSIHPSCGFANGSVLATVSGGTAPYTYLWSPNGDVTSGITNLAPGSYGVNVTDSLGCVVALSTNLVDIPGPTVTIPMSTNVSCFGGNNGSATVNIVSGTAPYSTTWLPFGGNTITGTSLIAGNYQVSVTDGLGCIAIDSVTITEPSPITISVDSIFSVSCNGGNNGSISVSATGGTGSYTYFWSPGGFTTPSVSNLSAGVYTIVVTDSNTCQTTISVNLTEPSLPLGTSGGLVTNPTCFNTTNGSAFVNVIGGTAPYSYLWSNGQTGSTATNLIGGTYSVIIMDTNGCVTNDTVSVIQPTQVNTIAGINDTICLGSSGVVSATATGGVGVYSYSWQPVAVTNAGILNITPIENTTYTVMAFDQNGCPGGLDTVSAVVISLDSSNIAANISVPLICLGQSTQVSVQQMGIQDSLTFTWDNGLGSGSGPFTVFPTQPTTYVVTATNICGVSVSDSVRVEFSPPPILSFTVDADSVCFPEAVQFFDNSVTGNPLDQLHSWDWNFGDGNTSQLQSPAHTYSQAGTFQVVLTVTTGNGCVTDNSSAPLTITVFPKPIASFSVNSNSFYLPTDQLEITNTSSGGTLYNWDFGDGTRSTDFEPSYLYSTIGNYRIFLLVTNQYGCSDTAMTDVVTVADLVVPNAFTPDPSGPSGGFYDVTSLDNNIFFPYTSGVVAFEFEVFDRWGELIFRTDNVEQGWDGYYKGELVQKGVYIWKIYAKLNNGKVFNKAGNVTLLR